MSANDLVDDEPRRTANTGRPYNAYHPVPTIERYEQRNQRSHVREQQSEDHHSASDEAGLVDRTVEATKGYLDSSKHESGTAAGDKVRQPYRSENQNDPQRPTDGPDARHIGPDGRSGGASEKGEARQTGDSTEEARRARREDENIRRTTIQGSLINAVGRIVDPKEKLPGLHPSKSDGHEREVTDPITHLPVTIHDTTDQEIETAPENPSPPGPSSKASERPDRESGDGGVRNGDQQDGAATHLAMEKLFPPPSYEAALAELIRTFQISIVTGLCVVFVGMLFTMGFASILGTRVGLFDPFSVKGMGVSIAMMASTVAILGGFAIWTLRGWIENKVAEVWRNEVWEAEREQGQKDAESDTPESAQWLNSILASVWPLVNPDLFTSLADTLEDVMQASLPKMVRMISVEDLGQGSESLRILGVRWLPMGLAASSVSVDGQLRSGSEDDNSKNDRKVQGEGEVQDQSEQCKEKDKATNQDGDSGDGGQEDQNFAEGMEAEEGGFVNFEIAFAYRARAAGKSLKTRAKNAHLYLVFYLFGGIRFPVWVELRGIVGTLRMRLQLTPDPPFCALCTLTFLGQPNVDLSCVPLTRKGLNVMDLPFVSGFVQSSVNAAMAEYVAPKSLTLDLKDMIVGDDFKKDTDSRGVLVVMIKRAWGFKEGDEKLAGLVGSSSDTYVAVGWAKFGKPVWSTRVIVGEMDPVWEETTFIPVGHDEINADERLRVQLWDSDRTTADDDLGTVEVSLADLMKDPETKGKVLDRKDGLSGMKPGESLPGTLEWSIGYFAKTGILPEQLQRQTEDKSIGSIEELKRKVSETADRKLREATVKDESEELSQQKAQDLHTTTTHMIASAPPSSDYPSGLLSIMVHQISDLELAKKNKNPDVADDGDDKEEQEGDDLPSSYCHIILNHTKIFRTRTKPKNSQPFFNAGTERFIRDWRNTEVALAIRDARVHEDDPILGIVVLPLDHVFKHRSQVNASYPLFGGIGYGRIRISMVFRSVQLQLPKELLGWDYGTLEVTSDIRSRDLSQALSSLRLKLRTNVSKGKMSSTDDGWKGKKDAHVHLAVRKRYCSNLIIEFRRNRLGPDTTPAFAVIWLQNIPDEEPRTVTVPVWKNRDHSLKRAESSCDRDFGEKLGYVEVPLRFWPGLSGYHKALASKDENIHDMVEVLDCANADKEAREEAIANEHDATDSSNSDSDSQQSGQTEPPSSKAKTSGDGNDGGYTLTALNKGPVGQIKDYTAHKGELHRRHRGLMQWKTPRTMKWMKTKAEHSGSRLSARFAHKERDTGIEMES